MELLVEFIVLLLIACGVGVAVKYIRLPYTIALVLVGLFVGLSGFPQIPLTRELVFLLFLPPLLFESALNMDLSHLRENFKTIGILAILGVLVSTVLIGLILHKLLGIPLEVALLFGAMISPTDPVSVLATFKALNAPKRLAVILEGESILNDGTAVVLFGIIYEMITHGKLDILHGFTEFVIVCLGGAIIGFALGYLTYRILAFIDDHLIEISITLISAYSSFLLAEHLHLSGVIAVVCAGLIIGNYGKLFSMSPSTRIVLTDFWSFVVFVINSIVFLLIGIDTQLGVFRHLNAIAVAIVAVLVARALVVYPTLAVFKFPNSWRFVVFWGGLRGAIPVALALSLSDILYSDILSSMVFGVVLFSLVFQGLTLELFVKRAFRDVKKEEFERTLGRYLALKHAELELRKLVESGEVVESIAQNIEEKLKEEIEQIKLKLDKMDENLRDGMKKKVLKEILNAEKYAIRSALAKGLISEEVAVKLIKEIDEKIAGLDD